MVCLKDSRIYGPACFAIIAEKLQLFFVKLTSTVINEQLFNDKLKTPSLINVDLFVGALKEG